MLYIVYVFVFKQKAADEMRISDWSADVCSSDLARIAEALQQLLGRHAVIGFPVEAQRPLETVGHGPPQRQALDALRRPVRRHLVAGHAPDLFRIGLEEDREQLVAEGVDGPVLEGTDVAPGNQTGLCDARTAMRPAPHPQPNIERPAGREK